MMNDHPEAIIVDVRTDMEIEEGHIPGARQMDITQTHQFMDSLSELDPSAMYLVYCRSGSRSAQACALMESRGIQKVYNLLGGFIAWNGEVSIDPIK